MHGRRQLDENKMFRLCLRDPDSVSPVKLYKRKYIFMMETSIAEFHNSLYIPEIKKLSFHLPCVRILGTHHCGNT